MNGTNQTTLQSDDSRYDDLRIDIVLDRNNIMYLLAGFAFGALVTMTLVLVCTKCRRARAKRRRKREEEQDEDGGDNDV